MATVIFAAASTAFLGLLLVHEWPATSTALKSADLSWLLPAAALATVAFVLMAWRWRAALHLVSEARSSHHRVIGAYFAGEIGKYVPGGIFSMLGRAELARREGHDRPAAYSSVLLSLITCYLAASVVSLVLAAIVLSTSSAAIPWWPLIIIVVVAASLLHPAINQRLLTLARRITHRDLALELPSFHQGMVLSAWYVPVWLGIGFATVLCTRSITPHLDPAQVALAAIIGWVVGFVTPSPGGAGVREVIFIALAGISIADATAAAILARLVFIGVDAAGALVGWLLLRRPPVQHEDHVA